MSNGNGYIYVKDWDRFQHYKTRNPPWIKLYTDLLSDDDFMDLSLADRVLLIGIWMLTAKHGQGRVQSDWKRLLQRLSIPFGPRSENPLDHLVDAGFISISAIKGASTRLAPSLQSTEKDTSTSPSRTSKTERASASARTPRRTSTTDEEPKLSRAERQRLARQALHQVELAGIKSMNTDTPPVTHLNIVKPLDPEPGPPLDEDDELI